MNTAKHFSTALAAAGLVATFAAAPAHAAILTATGSTLRAVFAAAQGGDTIQVIGAVGTLALRDRIFADTLTIDATGATFTDSISFVGVSNVAIVGGTFGKATAPTRAGSALALYSGSQISLTNVNFIGNGTAFGLRMSAMTDTTITGSSFNGFKAGLSVSDSDHLTLQGSSFVAMTSDGVNFADTSFVTASGNSCSGSVPPATAHPDCIQLWSSAGKPFISDITISNNSVTGNTQGLTMFDGGGVRIAIIDNIINTSFPQGIACYNCYDSTITGNQLTTIPGSRWRTSINVVGGANNIVANNSVGSLPPAPAATLSLFSAPSNADGDGAAPTVGPLALSPWSGQPFLSNSVPEPEIWAELLCGFGLAGSARRRLARRSIAAAMLAE